MIRDDFDASTSVETIVQGDFDVSTVVETIV
jgi:hypothetical protein